MAYVGARLRGIRKARGLTQDALAAKTGIARTDLSGIENDRVSLGPDRASTLAGALKVSVLELLPESEPDEKAVLLEDRLAAIEAELDRRRSVLEDFVEAATGRLAALEAALGLEAPRSTPQRPAKE